MLPGDEKNRRTVTPYCAPSPTTEWWVIQWIMDGGEQQSWDTILWKFRFHFMANVGFLLPISLLHLFILLMALFITNLPRLFPLRKPRLQKNQQYTPHPPVESQRNKWNEVGNQSRTFFHLYRKGIKITAKETERPFNTKNTVAEKKSGLYYIYTTIWWCLIRGRSWRGRVVEKVSRFLHP